MSGLNGTDVVQGIKRTRPDVAVVMMSSTMVRGPAGHPHLSEALAFLKKPFYPNDVDAVLKCYFGISESQ